MRGVLGILPAHSMQRRCSRGISFRNRSSKFGVAVPPLYPTNIDHSVCTDKKQPPPLSDGGFFGGSSGTRTQDPLIKSQML
jgi:hypothetical protein